MLRPPVTAIAFGFASMVCAGLRAQGPEGALQPGVTLWVYDVGELLERRPSIAEGQTPNYYAVLPRVDFADGFDSTYGRLEDMFAGEVRAWLDIQTPGEHQFKVECDDGAALFIDGHLVADTELLGGFEADGAITLDPGRHRLSLLFYEDRGKFHLRLKWRPPGAPAASAFTPLPDDILLTEAGQTFASSPGPKRWYYDRDPNRPGDGRPLETVHPGFTLEDFRGPDFRPAVGGLAFLPDRRLAVSTWDKIGAVYLLSNLHDEEPGGVRVTRFAEGLGEPLGIAVVGGDIYVSQKQEVTRLRDTDGDGIADRYDAIAGGWPASHNYHEFTFNLVPLDGSLFITTSVPLKTGHTCYQPGSTQAFSVPGVQGSVLRIDPRTSAWEVFARGLRAPNGMAIGLDGELFCCDNQGCWLPASRLNHIRKGGFYGHQIEPDGAEPSDPPVVWLPHGEIGNSPTEPILVPDGVFRRQLLVGDVTHGGINRVFVENVQGRYQGAVFQFSQGLEAGVNRLAWGPDGCLYVGGIGADGNWHHKEKKFGLQRLRPNGRIAFEMLAVESRADGFLVTFTQPVPESILTEPESYLVRSWRYRPTIDYGGPKLDQKTLRVEQVVASPDRTRAFLKLSPLEPDTVVYLRLRNFRDDQDDEPFATEAWYTLNTLAALHGPAFDVLSPSLRVPVSPRLLPPSAAPPDVIVLFDGTSAAAFQHADGSPVKWRIEGGPGGPALVVDQGAGDIVTRESFGDCFLHLEWLSPPGGPLESQRNGNSGVKLQSRYEIQIMNAPAAPHPPRFNEAGAIYRLKAPDVNASLGAGVWQTYDIRFRAPRWKDGAKTASARMTAWWNGILVHDDVEVKAKTGLSADEAPGEHPILLQAHPSDAMGEVRFRNVWVTRRTQ